MNDYVPLTSLDSYSSPHDSTPPVHDPAWVWVIAASPLLLLATFVFAPNLLIVPAIAVLAIAALCVRLARRDTHPNPWLAVLPPAYLFMRASRRASGPHRGNPVWPLTLNLFLGFAVGYYLALHLASIAGMVNRG